MRECTPSASRPASAPGECTRISDCPAVPPAVLIALRVGGPARRRLLVFPKGNGEGAGTHLSVFLEAQDTMWAPTAECTFTLVNQADASR
jgi:hypothetical protein